MTDQELTVNLWNAILRLKTREEARRFFGDLLTKEEIVDMAKRWRVAQLLDHSVSYKEIQRQTALSSRTIARISAWLKGGFGGYRLMLRRLPPHAASHVFHSPSRD